MTVTKTPIPSTDLSGFYDPDKDPGEILSTFASTRGASNALRLAAKAIEEMRICVDSFAARKIREETVEKTQSLEEHNLYNVRVDPFETLQTISQQHGYETAMAIAANTVMLLRCHGGGHC